MLPRERIQIKLNVAEENFKKSYEEYYKAREENMIFTEGVAYSNIKYYQGIMETCKFILELLEKGD